MNSLTELNSHSRTILEVSDNRPSGVILDRDNSLIVDQQIVITTTSNVLPVSFNIVEIVNYATANVRYRLTIETPSPSLTPTSLAWATIPAGVTLTQVGQQYTLSGISTAAQWEIIKSPTWTIPAGFAGFPVWYVSAELIFFDSTLSQDVNRQFDIFDTDFFYFAEIEADSLITVTNARTRSTPMVLSMTATLFVDVNDASLKCVTTVSCVGTKFKGSAISLTANAGLVSTVVVDFFTLIYSVGAGTNISMNLRGVSSVNVTWGDGQNDTYTGASVNANHTYASAGQKKVVILGTLTGFSNQSPIQLIRVKSFASVGLTDLNSAFLACINIVEMTATLPSSVLDLSYCFAGSIVGTTAATNTFNLAAIGSWNTANVKFMTGMFHNNPAFNQDISSWNTGQVVNMSYMFGTSADEPQDGLRSVFNNNINTWNTSSVTNMSYMFVGASFNGNLNSWNVSNVTTMKNMFSGSGSLVNPYNNSLNSWIVTNVTDMSFMFFNSNYNSSCSAWNVSNVITMKQMFNFSAFNQPIGSWNTISVNNMDDMFSQSPFNQTIGSWNVSNVTDMSDMFSFTPFNQNISTWNVSKVNTMARMFDQCNFNQPINAWNTASVNNMTHMFRRSNFNQPLNLWNVTGVSRTAMTGMFQLNGTYDQNLSSWSVSHIASKPTNWDASTNANWQIQEKPNWGV